LRSTFWLTAPASIEPLSPEASTIIGGAGVGGGERLGDVLQALALGLDAKDGLRSASRRSSRRWSVLRRWPPTCAAARDILDLLEYSVLWRSIMQLIDREI
jgi:hypothetical protein